MSEGLPKNNAPEAPEAGDSPFRCGIVLHPAGHTRSPAMHRAAYQELGLAADYQAFDVPPDGLADAVTGFRESGLRQFAVSIPHKEAVMGWVDDLEPVCEAIGALNTVTRIEGRLVGTNTDWMGALQALEREVEIDGQRAVVLGAGGTARAVTYALKQRGCEVFVLNRTVERAEQLVQDLGADRADSLHALPDLAPQILVNTTSVGLSEMKSPIPADTLRPGMVVLDAVYSPERTQLLLDAEEVGARTVGGKWMLVYQAVEQLRLWTRLLEPASNVSLNLDDGPLRDQVIRVMSEAFDEAGR